MRREGETKRKTGGGGGGGLGPPDLDLDLVEAEAQEEEERSRSQTVRRKEKRDGQREQGSRSKSLPKNSARSWGTSLSEERVEVEEPGRGKRERRSQAKSRRTTEADRETEERREEREGTSTRHTMHSGSSASAQRSAFSFLGPMEDDEHQRLSDNESTASFSEVSLSAASIATAGWREESDWRRAGSPWDESKAPGPWLKPSPQRLTRVLTSSQLRGRELAGGLSL